MLNKAYEDHPKFEARERCFFVRTLRDNRWRFCSDIDTCATPRN